MYNMLGEPAFFAKFEESKSTFVWLQFREKYRAAICVHVFDDVQAWEKVSGLIL